jgi:TRAP-type uncharacterized transport system substrate-binding protein
MTSHRLTLIPLLLAALAAGSSPPATAQEASVECALRVASGPAGKVYQLMVRDMQAVCGAAVPVCAVASTGGLRNLSLLAASEAELGIVQIDTLKDMAADESTQSLQAVMPLHSNLLHVLTLTAGSLVDVMKVVGTNVAIPGTGRQVVLTRFSQLKGMTVAAVGSTQAMGQTLERQLRYDMRFVIADTDDQALALLRSGQVQAVFTLGGWPLPAIARHRPDSGLQLAELDFAPQAPFVAVRRNYQDLGALNFNFLAVPNLLVTRPFKAGGPASLKVAALQRCLTQHLDELQEGRYQPGWKEIKDTGNTHGVTAFVAPSKSKPVASSLR